MMTRKTTARCRAKKSMVICVTVDDGSGVMCFIAGNLQSLLDQLYLLQQLTDLLLRHLELELLLLPTNIP